MNITHLPESDMITDGDKPVRVGIYKRRVFIQGGAHYNRWDGARWREGAEIEDDSPEAHEKAFREASKPNRPVAYFQRCMAWWGLAENPLAGYCDVDDEDRDAGHQE